MDDCHACTSTKQKHKGAYVQTNLSRQAAFDLRFFSLTSGVDDGRGCLSYSAARKAVARRLAAAASSGVSLEDSHASYHILF